LVEGLLKSVVEESQTKFLDPDLLNTTATELMFCNFTDANARDYNLSDDRTALKASLNEIIEQYNIAHSKTKLKGLELFTYMVEHLSRISRILHKPRGHGLLVSLGGNGRATISKLATFINDGVLFKIDASQAYTRNEWLDDLRTLYKSAGVDDQP
jgi:dynein heavy chain